MISLEPILTLPKVLETAGRKVYTLRPKLRRRLGEDYLAIPMCPEPSKTIITSSESLKRSVGTGQARLAGARLEFFSPISQLQLLDQVIQLAVQNLGEVIQRQPDPVVREAILGIIVRADLVAPVAALDH